MFYLIRETLEPCAGQALPGGEGQYVALLSTAQWQEQKEQFDLGIDLEPDNAEIYTTKAVVNFDSLMGTFSIPDRNDICGDDLKFSFALDEKGVVFIDDTGTAQRMIDAIRATRRWRLPSLERFLYDFLEQIVKDDLQVLSAYDRELDAMEQAILADDAEVPSSQRLNQIRRDVRDLLNHYEQLLDLGQELEENENHFFRSDNLRYFRLFLSRIDRLRDMASALRDYTIQIRDLYKSHLDIKQNRIMTVLTVVTTIFLPLTLIAGWYGMNFRYMPELNYPWSYPIVICVCIGIVVGSLIFFKKKKWL